MRSEQTLDKRAVSRSSLVQSLPCILVRSLTQAHLALS